MDKVFTKGLNKDDQRDGLFKRLKNIECKNEELLKIKNDKTENKKQSSHSFEEPLSPEVRAVNEEIRIIQKDVDYKKLKITSGNNVTYYFSDFKKFNDLSKHLHFKKILIDDAEMKQNKFDAKLDALSRYSSKKTRIY